ncbi:hypothetical protein OR1_02448 [Geobacter sp. OR-1]|uniref:SdpI family protein n=1 Tax=Geobacter sp. OR-1 TaxID=1266765 RepID=UPI000543C9E1|nr:SdpI family protein [Geobacter sp. OR-1]GAM10160.1 hypothetical protein OR1_02448 [Geobacter sp. OR-1]
MDVFFWITDLSIPVIITVLGVLYRFRPPKEINRFFGYRTSNSMKSQKTWNYAQKRIGDTFPPLGLALSLIIALVKLFIPFQKEYLSLFNVGLVLLAIIALIIMIERELQKKFDANGNSAGL